MTNASNSTVALNWIDGAWVGAEQVRESIDPATYEVIGAYADGGLEAARQVSPPRSAPSKTQSGPLITNCGRG